MKKLLLAGLVFAALGCSHPGSEKLEGRWKGQKAEGVAPEAQAQANAFALGTEIVASGNEITIQTPSGKTTATYRVDKEDATTLVLHTEPGGAAETLRFNASGETMVWRVDAQRSISFRKAQ